MNKILIIDDDREPVSYTHLDVYKRQEYHCRENRNSVWADASECSKGFFGRILRVSWLAVSVL